MFVRSGLLEEKVLVFWFFVSAFFLCISTSVKKMSTFETKTSRPEIWKRVVVDDPLPSKSKSSNRSFIKSGQRSKSKAKVLQSVSLATLNSKKKKVSLSSDNSKHKKKKKKRTRGKIILGPRLQQRVESEENKHATTTDTQDTTNITTSNNDKEEDSINDTPRSQSSLLNEGEDLVNPDTRKIFSLTDVNLPTPVRTRLVKKRMERPASSPSTRPITNTNTNTSSTRLGGSGASAAKRLRPVSQPVSFDTLETALPKGSDTNLNSWFSNLENAQQESISHKNETNRMTKELGMWESRYHMLEKEIRKRELDHHDRVLNLQTVNRTLVTENNELKNDINDVHEARREDVKVHNSTMDKWKRRETNLESVRHEALVEAQLSKSRLNEQKLATASAISIAKTTKETLGTEVTRLRKQLNTKNEKEMKQIEYEKLRLEREGTVFKKKNCFFCFSKLRVHCVTILDCNYRESHYLRLDFLLLMSSIESYLSNKPKTVYILTIFNICSLVYSPFLNFEKNSFTIKHRN